MRNEKKIKALIIDDSALMRQVLSSVLNHDPDIHVVGTAPNPLIAREKIKSLKPDVLTLDVEMPGMDGITFLEKLMRLHPLPVVMVSSHTEKGAAATLRAVWSTPTWSSVTRPVVSTASLSPTAMRASHTCTGALSASCFATSKREAATSAGIDTARTGGWLDTGGVVSVGPTAGPDICCAPASAGIPIDGAGGCGLDSGGVTRGRDAPCACPSS